MLLPPAPSGWEPRGPIARGGERRRLFSAGAIRADHTLKALPFRSFAKATRERFGAVQSGQRKSLAIASREANIAGEFTAALLPRSMPVSLFRQAQSYYAGLRRIAYDHAAGEALVRGVHRAPVRLADTDEQTIAVWRSTWTGRHPSGAGGWPWDVLLRKAWRRPSAFHLAIWSGGELCGLAVGRLSRRRVLGIRHTLSVHFMEGSPHPRHPLKGDVALLVIVAADAYARAMGAHRLRLMNPLPGALPIYLRYGFTVARVTGQAVYCERRIQP